MAGVPGGQGLVGSPTSANVNSLGKQSVCFVYRQNCHMLCVPCYPDFEIEGLPAIHITNKPCNGARLAQLDAAEYEIVGDQICITLTDEDIEPFMELEGPLYFSIVAYSLVPGCCNCFMDFEVTIERLPMDM